MKFQVDVSDEVFWHVAETAERYGMRVPDFVAAVAARLTIEPSEEGHLEQLQAELRAARDSGWRAPRRQIRSPKKPLPLVFTDEQIKTAVSVIERKRK